MDGVSATDVHQTASRRLGSSGQRYTHGRRAIVEVLSRSERPLTLPEILDADASLAQSSAYRNLSELISADVVHRIVTSDEHARFELAQELTEHHHHLICVACGSVEDFTLAPALEQALDAALDEVAEREGFAAEHHRLDLVGRCRSCRTAATA